MRFDFGRIGHRRGAPARTRRDRRPRAAARGPDGATPSVPAPPAARAAGPAAGTTPSTTRRAPTRQPTSPRSEKRLARERGAFLSLDVTRRDGGPPRGARLRAHARGASVRGKSRRAVYAAPPPPRRRTTRAPETQKRRERHTEPAPKLSVVCARETAVHHERGARRGCTRRY